MLIPHLCALTYFYKNGKVSLVIAFVHLPESAAEESMSPDTGLSQQFFSYVGTCLPGLNQY